MFDGTNLVIFSDVAYQILGMEHRAPCKQMFCPYTPLAPGLK